MDKSSRNVLDQLVESPSLDEKQLNHFPHALMLINSERTIVEANRIARERGVEIGKNCWDTFGQCASILCSGYTTRIDDEEAKQIGIDAFCVKPLETLSLLQTIRNVLDDKDS